MNLPVRPIASALGRPPPAAAQPQVIAVPVAAHPLQKSLRDAALAAGIRLCQQFDAQLDAALQGLTADTRNAEETREAIALGQALATRRLALQRGFVDALRRRFEPLDQRRAGLLFDLDRLLLLPTEEVEENIMLTHLSERAEQLAGEAGRQLADLLRRAARELALPMLADALAPSAPAACFASAFRAVELSPPQRLLALRLVDGHGLALWPLLVESVLTHLQKSGFALVRALRDPAGAEALPPLSAQSLQALKAVQAVPATADAALATQLLHLAEAPVAPLPGYVVLSLAGHWMDTLLRDPLLPAGYTPAVEALRFPLLKAALVDQHLLQDAGHPVRRAIQNLMVAMAFASLRDGSFAAPRDEALRLIDRISVQASFVQDALRLLQPQARDLPRQLARQMLEEAEQRHESLLREVRTLVRREIESRTLDPALPTEMAAALTRAFFPLLSTLFLRHGAHGSRAQQGCRLLEQAVEVLAGRASAEDRAAVLRMLGRQLGEAGFAEVQIREIGADLQLDRLLPAPPARVAALPTARAEPAVSLPGQTPVQVLLRPGRWFRVRDARRHDDRWLSLGSYMPAQNRVTFRTGEGDLALSISASQLLDDLAAGLAEPLNPEPDAEVALQQIRRPHTGQRA